MLGHIITNALRYSPRGATVGVTWEFDADTLGISISDQGPGVPKSIKDNLDEPFTIGQDVLTKDASGLGLGLTICRHLMTMMGGKISIEDGVGGGTRVNLLLPNFAG